MRQAPEIMEVDNPQLEEMLRRVEPGAALDEKDAKLIRAVCESYRYVVGLVEDKNTSIRRLRQLLFGSGTEKTDAIVGDLSARPGDRPGNGAAGKTEATSSAAASGTADAADSGPVCPGHGRNGADAYRCAERIEVRHPSLSAGQPCPACGKGTVYDKAPGVVVRITGQPPLAATIYQLQKLRCHLCGQVFTAEAPEEAGDRKYDASAGSMIGLLKYGSGLPFNRLEGLQGHLEVPLPASTQWDIVNAVAANLAPAFAELIRQAAQGEVVHNDDTMVKILELMGQRRQEALAQAQTEGSDADQRTGLFTSDGDESSLLLLVTYQQFC
jgi:transposase